MKKLAEISTHKAIQTENEIQIIEKGFILDNLYFNDEIIDTLPIDQKDNIFAIMERLEENNRCNINEFLNEIK